VILIKYGSGAKQVLCHRALVFLPDTKFLPQYLLCSC
jgi:hypothetical protein